MSNIKFYSEFDWACSWDIDIIIEKINENAIDKDWSVCDLIEFYNILKYLNIERFNAYIEKQTGIDIWKYVIKINQKIGKFIGKSKCNYVSLYEGESFINAEDYFEIMEKYSIYKEIPAEDFKALLNKKDVHVSIVLKFKKITECFDVIIKEKILCDSLNAKTIISKYLKKSHLYFPPSLTEKEMLNLIDDYIETPNVNINVLREIINFPTGVGLNIPDKIRLHATRKAKEEGEKIFSTGKVIESGVSISYTVDQDEVLLCTMNGTNADIKVSRKWIEENLDYPTLWNNFIYVFNIFDDKFRLTLDSKKNDISALEAAFMPTGNHLYKKSFGFNMKEMVGNAEIYSYIKVLNVLGVRIEDMVKWFFCVYLKEEFSIENFIVMMPSEETSYFEKCRTILPEIDRIIKQYNVLIEDGKIDQGLIQISSNSVKNKDIKSFNQKKYVYPMDGWYQTASYLLFSDQSGIFYMPNKGERYKNFLDLIINEKVSKEDFKEFQIQRMKWLFDNDLIQEDEKGYINVVDINLIYILRELYYEDVLSYWHYPDNIKMIIEEMASHNYVCFESTLFTRNEQDYIDYYLNKAKFTNGHDIRNRYLHGTNSNDEKQYEKDYYSIIKIIIIIIIKINDDLCITGDYDDAGLYKRPN
ncbi:MAG TPA: hypothetical protein DIV40_09340 [Clostridiales bacterium]|jgi:hypothetical protein|nr:hypothetical protein [Clostridiales bacterium]